MFEPCSSVRGRNSVRRSVLVAEDPSVCTVGRQCNGANGHSSTATMAADRLKPPTITRPLLSTYRCLAGEQTHFLVEYYSSPMQCQCTWEIQQSKGDPAKPITEGSIVHTDFSSILIIEAMTPALQGLYTFGVENVHGQIGRAHV